MKTQMSRFQIHDELTAPEGSMQLLRGAVSPGGRLPNFVGVLAGAPAALRAYARFRSELRHGQLDDVMLERIALAIAAHHGSKPDLARHGRSARANGLGLDEMARARDFDSNDPRAAALLRLLRALVTEPGGPPPLHVHEQAREAGWTDEQILEAISHAALESLTAMINVAGDVPVDGCGRESRELQAA